MQSTRPWLGEAIDICDRANLTSKRALAIAFSGSVLFGPGSVRKTIAQVPLDRPMPEQERIEALTDKLAGLARRPNGGGQQVVDFFLSLASGHGMGNYGDIDFGALGFNLDPYASAVR
jgi:hypothetical protein